MPDPEFEKLVKEFAKQQQGEAVDWGETRDWWVQRVSSLFDQMEGWLGSLISSGVVKSTRHRIFLSEENLGRYQTQSLELELAGKRLKFNPVGTLLIGAYGRIDVSGPQGGVTLLLLNTNDKAPLKERRDHVEWFVAQPNLSPSPLQPRSSPQRGHPRPRSEYRPLTQEAFEQLFTSLFGVNR